VNFKQFALKKGYTLTPKQLQSANTAIYHLYLARLNDEKKVKLLDMVREYCSDHWKDKK
jgi:hypothetical protein